VTFDNRSQEYSVHHVDFLNAPLVDLPKTRSGDFVAFMDDLFRSYIEHVKVVNQNTVLGRVIATRLSTIQGACDALMQSLRNLVAGDRSAAYADLDMALTILGPHFNALCPSGDMSVFVNPMYRFRPIDATKTFERKDLFHIPFELQAIIKEMRYSVTGLPCLYLGGSTHVCWKELGQPDINTISVSRYAAVPNTNLKVLNFGHRMPVLAAYAHTEPNRFLTANSENAFMAAQVACWPLVAICSIRVPDRTKNERPEYLMPQLILEWITKTRAFHGVRFFSTHYTEYIDNPKTYMNYVFPASAITPQDYCANLKSLFELTEPKTWAQAKALPISLAGISRPIYKIKGVVDTSLETEFGVAEDGLLTLPLDTFSP
tara:strand:- start:488 stop:1609 length:1122 start_codon:yes stop_codon:yes gene_type:complete